MGRPEPTQMRVLDRPLTCVVCAGDRFTERSITIITSGFANSGLNKSGQAVTCAACGYIHQFVTGSVTPG